MTNSTQRERVYRWLSLGLFLFLPLLAFFTLPDYGMGWDEVTRWNSGDAKIEYYQALLASDAPMEVVRSAPNEAYPGLFDMTLSLLHRATGWDRFLMGHWQAFIFGLAGLGALWRIGYIFGGARLGFWSVALLVLTPAFYGHWFHNPKDIPFAATYTVGLWGLIEFLRRYPKLSKRWALVAALSCGACMATRIAGMVLLAYLLAGVAMLSFVYLWTHRGTLEPKAVFKALWAWWLSLPLISAGAYLTLLPWWPAAHKNLLSVSGSTLQQLHVRASEIPLFFRGEIMLAADAPHYYTLWMFAIKATELMLVGLLIGVPLAQLFLRRTMWDSGSYRSAPALSLLLLGAFFPLLYLTYSAPALHNGARHFLFAFPALAVCAAWGYLECGAWLRQNRPQLLRFAQVVFAFLLLLPIWHLVQLHPYQYIYYNSLAGGPAGAYSSCEGEYWFTSTKHAVERLEDFLQANPRQMPDADKIHLFILGPWQVAERFLPEKFKLTRDPDDADFMILNTQMLLHTRYSGEELFRIERMGTPVCLVLRAPE